MHAAIPRVLLMTPQNTPHQQSVPTDSADMANAVRDLAQTAHRFLNDPSPDPHRVRDLMRRISSLRNTYRHEPENALARWLAALECRIGVLVAANSFRAPEPTRLPKRGVAKQSCRV